jgi:two-component system, chemotaxis family, CheB/CheR fusion protein
MRVPLSLLSIKPTRAPILRYGVAVLSTTLALIPALLLPNIAESRLAVFAVAVMVSAWYGGWKPGLVATSFALTVSAYFAFSTRQNAAQFHSTMIRLALFFVLAILICWLNAALRATQESLRRSEINFRSLVTNAPYGICRCDSYGQILDVNPAWLAALGYSSADELLGKHLAILYSDTQQWFELADRLRSAAPFTGMSVEWVRKDGSPVAVRVSGRSVYGARKEKTFELFAEDVTERRGLEQQLRQSQKMEAVGRLAGGIAHDFNNLLTGILGNASLALEDLAPGTTANVAVQSVLEAAERAAQLACQMLAYSGKGHFVLEHIDLSARVQETLPLIRAAIPANVALELDLDRELPLINADTAQMQQLIMNIIINGAEAIPEGTHGKVTISTRPQNVEERFHAQGDGATSELQPGLYVMLEVNDTGSGMDEETRARIFDPFFTTKFTGRGLGLAAVLGIVRGHRGSIQVLSAPAKGSVFRVLLPAVEGQRKANPSPADSPAGDLRGTGAVLVVDDEQTVRNVARQALERLGYTVLVAADGSCGLDLFRREADRLKCVVLDLTMPVMSGEETLARMKAVRADIPIILSSGFNEVQAVRRFEGKGLAGFLQKPYRAGALVEMIQHVVNGLESE